MPDNRVQTIVEVSVHADGNNHYVHIRKGPGASMGHPVLTPNEAEWLARDIGNAAADARRKNISKKV